MPEIKTNRIGCPINRPVDFLAIGLNYKEHVEGSKSKLPVEPILFNKSSGCIQGPNDNVIKPKAANKMDYECEVAIIIGRKGKYIKESQARNHIFGYCIVNDISERSWQKERGGQWIKGKSIAGPCGPWLVTTDDIKNINNINLSLDINGERRQNGNTEKMIFNFNFLISHIKSIYDFIPWHYYYYRNTGRNSYGDGKPRFLKAGDKLHLKVDGLGEQFHEIIDD